MIFIRGSFFPTHGKHVHGRFSVASAKNMVLVQRICARSVHVCSLIRVHDKCSWRVRRRERFGDATRVLWKQQWSSCGCHVQSACSCFPSRSYTTTTQGTHSEFLSDSSVLVRTSKKRLPTQWTRRWCRSRVVKDVRWQALVRSSELQSPHWKSARATTCCLPNPSCSQAVIDMCDIKNCQYLCFCVLYCQWQLSVEAVRSR